MKMRLNKSCVAMLLLGFLLCLACKKPTVVNEEEQKPVPLAKGTPNGEETSKTIGPNGGVLTTPDGAISLEIPAGAVSAETVFSIQPISKTLQTAVGPAFRLRPENINFKKDINITFKYKEQDLEGTAEDFLFLAYQDAEGYFHRANLTSLDKVNQTLSVATTHFSDWYIERIFTVVAFKDKLSNREETDMLLIVSETFPDGSLNYNNPPIKDENIDGWFVNGPGTVKKTSSSTAFYKAPESIVEEKTVAVGVRVKNLFDKKYPNRAGTSGLAIVQTPIKLQPDEFFTWEIDGVTHTALSFDGAMLGSATTLLGTGLTGGINLSLQASKPGSYDLGNMAQADKFNLMVSLSGQSQVIYQGFYRNCNESIERYGAGKLTIESFGSVGGFIKGHFTATVYEPSCDHKSKQVTGSFKLRRKA